MTTSELIAEADAMPETLADYVVKEKRKDALSATISGDLVTELTLSISRKLATYESTTERRRVAAKCRKLRAAIPAEFRDWFLGTLRDGIRIYRTGPKVETKRAEPNIEPALTPEQARELMGVSKRAFDREVSLGRLRVVRSSPRVFVVSPDAVREWMARGGAV